VPTEAEAVKGRRRAERIARLEARRLRLRWDDVAADREAEAQLLAAMKAGRLTEDELVEWVRSVHRDMRSEP